MSFLNLKLAGNPLLRFGRKWSEVVRLLKLGNVCVFVQLIFGSPWCMNQLYKTQTLPNFRLPTTSGNGGASSGLCGLT